MISVVVTDSACSSDEMSGIGSKIREGNWHRDLFVHIPVPAIVCRAARQPMAGGI